MTPYTARAELYRSSKTFGEELGLKLDPIIVTLAVPFEAQRDARVSVDWAVDMARKMTRQTRALAAATLFNAMLGNAPKSFDWEKFEETEFEQLQAEAQELRARVERLERIRLNYRAFMEANGRNPDPIEKLGA